MGNLGKSYEISKLTDLGSSVSEAYVCAVLSGLFWGKLIEIKFSGISLFKISIALASHSNNS